MLSERRASATHAVATPLAIVAQVVLISGLAVLLSTGRWLADPAGLVTLLVGAAGIGLGGWLWQRWGQTLPLLVVDAWFVAFGLTIAAGPLSSCVGGCDPGDGPSELDPWRFIEALGGPLQFVSVVWLAAGLVGILALVRTRR